MNRQINELVQIPFIHQHTCISLRVVWIKNTHETCLTMSNISIHQRDATVGTSILQRFINQINMPLMLNYKLLVTDRAVIHFPIL